MSNTSADDKLIGFEYQFYYFLLSLLEMQQGDTVGFEVMEDVHIENGNKITFCQLKHTIQRNAHNQPINLTTSDIDLWKTLSLWVDIINKEIEKDTFLQNSEFIFASNKSDNDSNRFLTKFKTFLGDENINTMKSFLETYKTELKATDTKVSYISNILSLDSNTLKNFFSKIKFMLNLDEIRQNIKEVLRNEKYIKSDFRIDQTYIKLVGLLKDDFFDKVSNKVSVQYSQEEFALKVSSIFANMRSEAIPFISEIQYSQNQQILDMTFAKQLKDIAISNEDIYAHDYNRILTITNLKELHQNNEITQENINILDKNTEDIWQPVFEEIHLSQNNQNNNAKLVLLKTKQIDLDLAGQKISLRAISNGQFIKMSNIPKIGWKSSWKEDYINE